MDQGVSATQSEAKEIPQPSPGGATQVAPVALAAAPVPAKPAISKKLIVYQNGDFAYGEMDEKLQRQGFVQYQSLKGPHLMGFFDSNARQGECRVDFDRSIVYTGNYKGNVKDGIGVYFQEEQILIGNFKDGLLNGYGRYFANKSYYEGFFQDSKMHGYGIEIMPNSDCYFGEFKRGKKEGLGFYLFGKGGYYYGFFKAGEKTEMGVLYDANYACYYIGQFKDDMRNGRGMQM